MSEDEIQTLLDACPDYLRHIVVCAINTGMRRGEILSLKWDQVPKREKQLLRKWLKFLVGARGFEPPTP